MYSKKADVGNIEEPESSSSIPVTARKMFKFLPKWFKIGVFLRQTDRYLEGLPRYLEFLRISEKIFKAIFVIFRERPNTATGSLSAMISDNGLLLFANFVTFQHFLEKPVIIWKYCPRFCGVKKQKKKCFWLAYSIRVQSD